MISPELDREDELLDSDPFDDDEPLACGVENPEMCDSCM